ncbi:MAG: hypothetical protein ACF788_10590, partial [Novipirellula sp. JB048]
MQKKLKELRKQLQGLRVTMAETADSLIAAADDLKTSGTPLNSRLLDECAGCSFEFNELVEGVRKVVADDPDAAGASDFKNLDQLEDFFEVLEQRFNIQEKLSRAASIIERASCVHSDADIGDDFRPRLEQLIEKARQALNSTDDDTKRNEVDELLGGSHVLAAIVQLIADDGSLNDREADHMADLIEQEFGRKVERAVIRGRFQFVTKDINSSGERPEEAADETSQKPDEPEVEETNELTVSDSPSKSTADARELSSNDHSSQRDSSSKTKRAKLRRQLGVSLEPDMPVVSDLPESLAPLAAESTSDANDLPAEVLDTVEERPEEDAIDDTSDERQSPGKAACSTTEEIAPDFDRKADSEEYR